MKGPSKVVFTAANKSVTNVTNLTKGDYLFKLTVIDNDGNNASSSVQLRVTQGKTLSVFK